MEKIQQNGLLRRDSTVAVNWRWHAQRERLQTQETR